MRTPKRLTMTFCPDIGGEVSSGGRPFPIDMLRYDECWPATERDSFAIVAGMVAAACAVTLTKVGTGWNLRRWQSFGWVPHEITKLRQY